MNVTGQIQFRVTQQSAEEVVGEMPVQSGILNPFGVVHGGAILWFADVCATVLAAGGTEFVAGAPGFPLTINVNSALLGNQNTGAFTATSTFVKRGRTVTVVRTRITGEAGRLIADVTTSHLPSK